MQVVIMYPNITLPGIGGDVAEDHAVDLEGGSVREADLAEGAGVVCRLPEGVVNTPGLRSLVHYVVLSHILYN